jgi:hypothetical protein
MGRSRTLLVGVVVGVALLFAGFVQDSVRNARHIEEPKGCDWFGYMRQSQLFTQKGWIGGLDTAIRDDRTLQLLGIVKSLGADPVNWAHGAGPHCHNYKTRTDSVILQYPPGTGFLMAFFPEGAQARWLFIASCAAVFVMLLLVVVNASSLVVPVLVAMVGLLCFWGLNKFMHDRSIYASVVATLGIGWLTVEYASASSTRRQSIAAAALGVLIALSAAVRLPNILLALGPGIVLALAALRRPWSGPALPAIAYCVGLAAGLLPLLAANAINAGHPFATTYGSIDTTPPDLSVIGEGLNFYFMGSRGAGVYNVLAAVALTALLAAGWRMRSSAACIAGAIGLINFVAGVAYIVTHVPRNMYYLFPCTVAAMATAVFGLIALDKVRAWGRPPERLAPAVRIAIVVVSLGAMAVVMRLLNVPISPHLKRPDVTVAFESTAVVWGDFSTGPVSYYLRRQASVLPFVHEELRERVIELLSREGVPQYFVGDSIRMDPVLEWLADRYELKPVGKTFDKDTYLLLPRTP